jgi:hypothetical protein
MVRSKGSLLPKKYPILAKDPDILVNPQNRGAYTYCHRGWVTHPLTFFSPSSVGSMLVGGCKMRISIMSRKVLPYLIKHKLTAYNMLPYFSICSFSLSSTSLVQRSQASTNSSNAVPPSSTPSTSLVSCPDRESFTSLYGCMT